MYKNKFKKFGGSYIPDIVGYLKEIIEKDPTVTISVGCDSIQKRRRTIYAVTIMLYNIDVRKGAHVVFFRESFPKVRDNQERLYKEATYLHDLGTYLDTELSGFYTRKDIDELSMKKYKYHLVKCAGEYSYVMPYQEEGVINGLHLSAADKMDYKLVDLHADFNPFEGSMNEKGVSRNKSYIAYKSYVPWLRGIGFRVWAKPSAPASSTAADLLLQD